MTAIEWTDETWNPVTGCSKVSPGCAHCYAETLSLRHGWSGLPWTPANAEANVVLHPERLRKPLTWRRSRMVFVNSMSDLFHEAIPYEFVREIFNVMRCCDGGIVAATGKPSPRHTFQVLTKRPEHALKLWRERKLGFMDWPDNIWLGTSIENNRWAGRADALRETPAAPSGSSRQSRSSARSTVSSSTGVDWLIAGGESGPKHRPVDVDWVRDLRDRCASVGVAFFFKQWGGRTPKSGGRDLDGRTHDQYPIAA